MNGQYFKSIYVFSKITVIGSTFKKAYWIKNCEQESKGFVGYVQVFSNKTATLMKSTALVACLVQVVLLNWSYSYRLWLI